MSLAQVGKAQTEQADRIVSPGLSGDKPIIACTHDIEQAHEQLLSAAQNTVILV
jgi:hypothetical protein